MNNTMSSKVLGKIFDHHKDDYKPVQYGYTQWVSIRDLAKILETRGNLLLKAFAHLYWRFDQTKKLSLLVRDGAYLRKVSGSLKDLFERPLIKALEVEGPVFAETKVYVTAHHAVEIYQAHVESRPKPSALKKDLENQGYFHGEYPISHLPWMHSFVMATHTSLKRNGYPGTIRRDGGRWSFNVIQGGRSFGIILAVKELSHFDFPRTGTHKELKLLNAGYQRAFGDSVIQGGITLCFYVTTTRTEVTA